MQISQCPILISIKLGQLYRLNFLKYHAANILGLSRGGGGAGGGRGFKGFLENAMVTKANTFHRPCWKWAKIKYDTCLTVDGTVSRSTSAAVFIHAVIASCSV